MAEFSQQQRKTLAKQGRAMQGGRFPIRNASDLANAIRAVGRAKGDHAMVRRYIIRRARALGLASRLPDNWDLSTGKLKS